MYTAAAMDFFNKLADTCITALVKRVRGTPPAYFVDDSYDFFVLPLELRFKVYDFVMREEDGTQVRVECVHARWAPREWATSVQLLRTCQTIHIEGLQALYGSRSFVAGQAMVFVSFFNDITPRGFQHIKHLIIKQSMPPESIMDGEVAALDVSDGLLKSAWPKLESLRRVTLIYASDWRLSLSRELDLHVAFVRKIARSKPRSGHLLYDYMQLAPQPNVAWEIKLQVRQFDRTPLWVS